MTLEERNSIRVMPTDHFHFTNKCCNCCKSVEDFEIFPIKIDRRSGLDYRQYIENDYMCEKCLVKIGKLKK